MKTGIHPQTKETTFKCSCGAAYIAGSTLKADFKTEICSACHPFYTGKQKLIDTSGRVDKFVAKMKKAQALTEKKIRTIKKDQDAEEAAKESVERSDEDTSIASDND